MTSLLTLRRAFAINRVLIKHGLDEFLAATPFSRFIALLRLFALTKTSDQTINRGVRLNQALTELGPIFVKLGQMLSTRRDLLPEDLANELAKLQDEVKPFDVATAKKVIIEQTGCPLSETFSRFDEKPLASASVAQVHSAQLISGEEVVVKIIRPGIGRKIKADLKLLHLLARWAEKYSADGKRLHPVEIIRDYETTLHAELDLRIEAANTSQLRHNFEDSDILYVPKVYWEYCFKRMMVQERISGIPVGDTEKLIASGTDMQLLAHRGVEIFFTQVFRDSYFHADMHPGNIFVNASDPKNPKYIGIDCGIMGTLGETDKRYLAQNFVAFFNRDYREIARLHVQSGWVAADVSVEQFESAIRTACEPIFGKALEDISFGHFLIQLFQTARRFNMEVQPQLVLLQKTLLYIEGLGRQLYPGLDLWQTAHPFLEKWLKDNYGIAAIWNKSKDRAPQWLAQLPEFPEKIAQLVNQSVNSSHSENELVTALNQMAEKQAKLGSRLRWAILAASLAIVAVSGLIPEENMSGLKELLLIFSGLSFVVSFRV